MAEQNVTRRRFLQSTIAFSAAASLTGCGWGVSAGYGADPVVDEPSHFLMVGDWGTAGARDEQTDVANAMQAYINRWKFSANLLFMLGDNFYGDMPGAVNSPRWQSQFEAAYPKSVFDCPAYAVLGNHDYQRAPTSKVDIELAYAAAGTSRWTMPGRYSRLVYPLVDPVVTIIRLDSNMPNEAAQPLPPDGSYYTPTDDDRLVQLQWLTEALAKPLTTPFLLVLGHHPLFSNGPHGDNQTLIRDWDPLFRQAGVHMYLSGHDHDLQHLEFAGHPTSFVVSGGGGAELNTLKDTTRGPFAREIHGFTHLQVTPDLMTLRHLDTSGNLLHKFTKTADHVVTIVK